MKNQLKKFIFSTLILSMTVFSALGTQAAGPTGPVGPNQPTGITQPTGPNQPTGITQPIGPAQPSTDGNVNVTETDTTPTNDTVVATNDSVTSDKDGTNAVTGPASDNVTSQEGTSETNVNLDNNADINNNFQADLNTGNNTVGSNTAAGNIITGDITGTVNVLNLGNSVLGQGSTFSSQNLQGGDGTILLSPADSCDTIDISGANHLTGPGSNNQNNYNNNNIIQVVNNNDANATNDINIMADTGDNTIENNTRTGDLSTGDINLGVNLINILNVQNPNLQLSVDAWNILGDVNGDIALANDVTGPNSRNSNNVNSSNQINVSSTQNADISNQIALNANTGGNTVGQNTLAGNISTGNANLSSNVTNIANIGTPMYYIFNVYGDWDGDYGGLDPSHVIINQINDETGPGSDNQNNTNLDNQTNVDINNNATATNNINILANTGRNRINNNTVVGNICTGNISLSANIVNILNSFDASVTSFALGIVNIFGNWHHARPVPPSLPVQPLVAENPPVAAPSSPSNRVLGVSATRQLAVLPETGADHASDASPSKDDQAVQTAQSNPHNSPTLAEILIFLAVSSLICAGFRLATDLKEF